MWSFIHHWQKVLVSLEREKDNVKPRSHLTRKDCTKPTETELDLWLLLFHLLSQPWSFDSGNQWELSREEVTVGEDLEGGETECCYHGSSQSQTSGPSGLDCMYLIGYLRHNSFASNNLVLLQMVKSISIPSAVLPAWAGLVLDLVKLWWGGPEGSDLKSQMCQSEFFFLTCHVWRGDNAVGRLFQGVFVKHPLLHNLSFNITSQTRPNLTGLGAGKG